MSLFSEIGQRIIMQDNRMTSHPLFVVLHGSRNVSEASFITACFTLEGAEEYIKADGHNYDDPYIYIKSLHRNEEMIGLRNALMESARMRALR